MSVGRHRGPASIIVVHFPLHLQYLQFQHSTVSCARFDCTPHTHLRVRISRTVQALEAPSKLKKPAKASAAAAPKAQPATATGLDSERRPQAQPSQASTPPPPDQLDSNKWIRGLAGHTGPPTGTAPGAPGAAGAAGSSGLSGKWRLAAMVVLFAVILSSLFRTAESGLGP